RFAYGRGGPVGCRPEQHGVGGVTLAGGVLGGGLVRGGGSARRRPGATDPCPGRTSAWGHHHPRSGWDAPGRVGDHGGPVRACRYSVRLPSIPENLRRKGGGRVQLPPSRDGSHGIPLRNKKTRIRGFAP